MTRTPLRSSLRSRRHRMDANARLRRRAPSLERRRPGVVTFSSSGAIISIQSPPPRPSIVLQCASKFLPSHSRRIVTVRDTCVHRARHTLSSSETNLSVNARHHSATRMPKNPCVVCARAASAYKCPTCRAPYCSVACYKSHKGTFCKHIRPTAVHFGWCDCD